MAQIHVLDAETVDKIAAGEVVERPSSVVKELVENAIDAGAGAITVEAREGGIEFLRITDDGCGMEAEQIRMAFQRHATSKIQSAEDLFCISSLGFRGEALSSIAAVSRVEVITRTKEALVGRRILLEGGVEKSFEEVGAPVGTTFIMRNLFYNTPVRRKFLKQPVTEGGYIADLMEHLALSRPDISFQFRLGSQVKFHTSGNGNLREVIYRIYGRDITAQLMPISVKSGNICIEGYLGKPALIRSNRNFEVYFINGRFIKSQVIAGAIEEGYKEYLMQHKFPLCVLHIRIGEGEVDVNVHPTKMDVRFSDTPGFLSKLSCAIRETLLGKEMIPEADFKDAKEKREDRQAEKISVPEPFEKNRKVLEGETSNNMEYSSFQKDETVQMNFFEEKMLTYENRSHYRILGQVFNTYWLMQFEEKLFIIDQHAAHEKVKYERLLKRLREREGVSQTLMPPVVVSLTGQEEAALKEQKEVFSALGFEIENFGGREYTLRSVPVDLFGCSEKEMFLEVLGEICEGNLRGTQRAAEEKLASMACKAAVKGNNSLSREEAEALIDELLTLENPYNCPHGRPTIITMSKYELEKKFKRIV